MGMNWRIGFYVIGFMLGGICFLSGCKAVVCDNVEDRIKISPASRGAPDYSDMHLIREDSIGSKVEFKVSEEELNTLPADKMILKAWTALGKGAVDSAIRIAEKVIERFKDEAIRQQESLSGHFPKAGTEDNYKELNAVGTAYYIIAEGYEKEGHCDKALTYYRKAIREFPLSQNWDPRGWFWKVAEESKAKIDKISEVGCEKK